MSALLTTTSLIMFLSVPANALSPPVNVCGASEKKASLVSSEKLGRTIVWNFLKNEMNLPNSSIVGIISNMQAESNLRSDALGDAGRSYGLCQWHDSRCLDLMEYAESRNASLNDLETQLYFFKDEMSAKYPLLLESLRNMPDTREGAYSAAYDLCMKFECPEALYVSAKSRGLNAEESFDLLEKDCPDSLSILCNIYMAGMKDTEPFSNMPDFFGKDISDGFGPVSSEVFTFQPNQTVYSPNKPAVLDVPADTENEPEQNPGQQYPDPVTDTGGETGDHQYPGTVPENSTPVSTEPSHVPDVPENESNNSPQESEPITENKPEDPEEGKYVILFTGPDGEIIGELTATDPGTIDFPEAPPASEGQEFIGWAVVETDEGSIVYQAVYVESVAQETGAEIPEEEPSDQVSEQEEPEPAEEPVSEGENEGSGANSVIPNVVFIDLNGVVVSETSISEDGEIAFPENAPEEDGMVFIETRRKTPDFSHGI